MKQFYAFQAKLIVMLFVVFLPISSFAQNKGSISGKITDETGQPAADVNVLLKGTSINTSSDANGDYLFSDIKSGNYTLVISGVGIQKVEKKIAVKEGENAKLDVALESSSETLSEIVVTGSSAPRTKLESSVAITSMGAKAIEDRAPISTAAILQTIPGFVVESSGGEVGNNLFARGIPSAGAYDMFKFKKMVCQFLKMVLCNLPMQMFFTD